MYDVPRHPPAEQIAETSVTIDDAVFIIDTGKSKVKSYDVYSKMNSLAATWISQANAMQRTGRAGRSRPGICFRLYTQAMYDEMEEYSTAEILRAPLEELCLQVKLLQQQYQSQRDISIKQFLMKAIESPREIAIDHSIDLLRKLGALDACEELTEFGTFLANLPVHPILGKLILYGTIFQCLEPILTIVACLSHRDPFIIPMDFEKAKCNEIKQKLSANSSCDMIVYLHAVMGFESANAAGGRRAQLDYCRTHFLSINIMTMILDIRSQLYKILRESGFLDCQQAKIHTYYNLHSHSVELVKAILCAGLYPNVAKIEYKGKNARRPVISTRDQLTNCHPHPSSINARPSSLRPILYPDGILPTIKQKHTNLSSSSSMSHSLAPVLVFNEAIRSTQVYLRETIITNPTLIALMCLGDADTERWNCETLVEIGGESKTSKQETDPVSIMEESAGCAIPNDNEAATTNETEEESVNGSNHGHLTNQLLVNATCPSLVPFHLDEFFCYYVEPSDLSRLFNMRKCLAWLVHRRLNKLSNNLAIVTGSATEKELMQMEIAFVEAIKSVLITQWQLCERVAAGAPTGESGDPADDEDDDNEDLPVPINVGYDTSSMKSGHFVREGRGRNRYPNGSRYQGFQVNGEVAFGHPQANPYPIAHSHSQSRDNPPNQRPHPFYHQQFQQHRYPHQHYEHQHTSSFHRGWSGGGGNRRRADGLHANNTSIENRSRQQAGEEQASSPLFSNQVAASNSVLFPGRQQLRNRDHTRGTGPYRGRRGDDRRGRIKTQNSIVT